jgi:HSP20 family protein
MLLESLVDGSADVPPSFGSGPLGLSDGGIGKMIATPFTSVVVNRRFAPRPTWNRSVNGVPYRTIWSRTGNATQAAAAPLPVDIYATPDEVVIMAAAPGLHPENLDISYQQGTLVLSGKVAKDAQTPPANNAIWFAQELWNGAFQRVISLPYEVDVDQAAATFEYGLVRIVLPRAEAAKPRKIAISYGGQTEAISAGNGSQ